MWVKCDMLYTFGFARLDRFYKTIHGKRKYYDKRLSDEDMDGVRACIKAFLG